MSTKFHRSPSVHSSASKSARRRRRRIELSTKTKFLYFLNCAISSLLFFAFFERLEFLADAPLLDLHSFLPYYALHASRLLNEYSAYLIAAAFLAHERGMGSTEARTIFTELVSLLTWPVFLALNFVPFARVEDGLVYRILAGAFLFIMSTANLLTPRKPKHKKRPNSMISSAFSVASTPNSQCSSILSGGGTTSAHRRGAATIRSNDSTISSFSQRANPFMAAKNNGAYRLPTTATMSQTNNDSLMDYSQWIDDDMDTLPDPTREGSVNRRSTREGSVRRECTPFTELSGRLNQLTLNFGKENDSPRTLPFNPPTTQTPKILSISAITPSPKPKPKRGPFPSLNFNSLSKENPAATLSPRRSPFRSSPYRSSGLFDPKF